LKKYLKDVTLLAYDTRPENADNVIWSLQKCREGLYFYQVKFISNIMPDNLPDGIVWEYAPHIYEINDFNRYMFLEMGSHVDSSHMLYVHDHSWVLHPEIFQDSWLEYDYCGAPWPIVKNTYIANNGEIVRVGNGGFSIRSSYLMSLPKKLGWDLREEQGWKNEDGNIVCYWRKEMLENGIKYAPVEVAAKFSYENPIEENNYGNMKTFGFHKNHRENE